MGQNTNKARYDQFDAFSVMSDSFANMEVVKQLLIGNVIKDNKSGKTYFLKDHSYTSQQDYQNSYIRFLRKMSLRNQYVLALQDVRTKAQNTFCSTFYKIGLIYEYIQENLKDEIELRISEERDFQQKEVWSVVCSCILAMAHLQRTEGYTHSALFPQDIRLGKDGSIKVLSLQMIGIDKNHDMRLSSQKVLASTMLYCLTLNPHDPLSLQSFNYQAMSELSCSEEMKTMLRMLIEEKPYSQAQDFLIKLIEDTSLNSSQNNTPILKSNNNRSLNSHGKISKNGQLLIHGTPKLQNGTHHHTNKSVQYFYNCPRIEGKNQKKGQQRNEDLMKNSLSTLDLDQEDFSSPHPQAQFSIDHQLPDENQSQDDTQNDIESQIKDESKTNRSEQKNKLFIQEKQSSSHKQVGELAFLKEKNTSQDYIIYSKNGESKYPTSSNTLNTYQSKNQLFTNPTLLSQIKSDLEQIKMRQSSGGNSYKTSTTSLKYNEEDNQKSIPSQKKFETINELSMEYYSKSKENTNRNSVHEVNQSKLSLPKENTLTQALSCLVKQNNQKSQFTIEKNQFKYSQSQYQKGEKRTSQIPLSNVKNKQNRSATYDLFSQYANQTDKSQHNSKISSRSNLTEKEKNYSQANSRINVDNQAQEMTIWQTSDDGFRKNPKKKEEKVYNQSSMLHSSSSISLNKRENSISASNRNEKKNDELQYTRQAYQRGRYEGTKLNGMRHGHGTFYYSEGGKYVGQWFENRMHGHGTLYYPNQQIAYEGKWQYDQLYGYGTLYNQQVSDLKGPFDYRDWSGVEDYWIKFEGNFKADNKNGKGKLYLVNGQFLQASFIDDQVDGQGVLYRKDGSQVRGVWRKNKLIKIF